MDPNVGYLLITLGAVCVIAELVMFTGGVLAGIGTAIACIGIGLNFLFASTESGFTSIMLVCIGGPLLGAAIFYLWPYSPMSRKLIKSTEEDVTVANIAANEELVDLKGKTGKAISPLRPSGTAEFDGRRVDVITQGIMVDAGQPVKCIDVRAGKVLVVPHEQTTFKKNALESDQFS